MQFPNLRLAMCQDKRSQYELALQLAVAKASFRVVSADVKEFTKDERAKLAAVLGYSEKWLCQRVKVPAEDSPLSASVALTLPSSRIDGTMRAARCTVCALAYSRGPSLRSLGLRACTLVREDDSSLR